MAMPQPAMLLHRVKPITRLAFRLELQALVSVDRPRFRSEDWQRSWQGDDSLKNPAWAYCAVAGAGLAIWTTIQSFLNPHGTGESNANIVPDLPKACIANDCVNKLQRKQRSSVLMWLSPFRTCNPIEMSNGLGGRAGNNIHFHGRFEEKQRITVLSFPGMYTDEWDQLTAKENWLPKQDRINVACVFFPDESSIFYGRCTTPCKCRELYKNEGEHPDYSSWTEGRAPWGCKWFDKWCNNVQDALDFQQVVIIVYKRGLTKKKDGLGFSQRGEVAAIKKQYFKQRHEVVLEVDIDEFFMFILPMARQKVNLSPIELASLMRKKIKDKIKDANEAKEAVKVTISDCKQRSMDVHKQILSMEDDVAKKEHESASYIEGQRNEIMRLETEIKRRGDLIRRADQLTKYEIDAMQKEIVKKRDVETSIQMELDDAYRHLQQVECTLRQLMPPGFTKSVDGSGCLPEPGNEKKAGGGGSQAAARAGQLSLVDRLLEVWRCLCLQLRFCLHQCFAGARALGRCLCTIALLVLTTALLRSSVSMDTGALLVLATIAVIAPALLPAAAMIWFVGHLGR